MTEVYFVRHSEPDYRIHEDRYRPLTRKGKRNSKLVTKYLEDKKISKVFSSPYLRAYDTVKDYANKHGMKVQCIENFKERKIDNEWIEDFNTFVKMQWDDFDYKLPGGESLHEVQKRNIEALESILKNYPGENIVIGSHGTSLSTILHYYDNSFEYEDFNSIRKLMPLIVHFTFDGVRCDKIKIINLFVHRTIRKYSKEDGI